MEKVKNIYGHGISYINAISLEDYKLCTAFAFGTNNEYLFERIFNLMMTEYKVVFASYCINNNIDIKNETAYNIAFLFACSLEYGETALSV